MINHRIRTMLLAGGVGMSGIAAMYGSLLVSPAPALADDHDRWSQQQRYDNDHRRNADWRQDERRSDADRRRDERQANAARWRDERQANADWRRDQRDRDDRDRR